MNTVRRLIRKIRNLISVNYEIYSLLTILSKKEWVINRSTSLVIEGYPRSGNSFAEAAFRISNPNIKNIAHHRHAAAQILGAKKLNKPCLVVIREPIQASRSLMMHHPELFNAKDALQEYITFHNAILPIRDSFVLAKFETVITDFGLIINQLNYKFNTNFTCFVHDKENENKAFQLLNSISADRGTASIDGEPYSPDRSETDKLQRNAQKKQVENLFDDEDLTELKTKAFEIYRELISSANI